MLYSKGAVPPEPNAVMEPLLKPQLAVAGMAVIKIAVEVVMVTSVAFVQPVASFTVSVYCPGSNPVKKLLL